MTASAAAASRVLILSPAGASPAVRETLTRSKAELELAGFEVVVTERDMPRGSELRLVLEEAAVAAGAFAAIAIEREGPHAEVWVTDRVTGKTLVRRLDAGGASQGRTPAALAIRAVELVRASLLEAELPGGEGRDSLPDDVEGWMQRDGLAERSAWAGFGASLGACAFVSVDGLGAGFAPVVRLSWGAPEGLAARLSFAGPAGGPSVDGPLGTAAILQTLLLAEAVYAPLLDGSRFVPHAVLGLGAHYTHAAGELEQAERATTADGWAAAFVLGGGATGRITERLSAVADASLLFTAPRVVVAMDGAPLGSLGRPSLVFSLGLLATVE